MMEVRCTGVVVRERRLRRRRPTHQRRFDVAELPPPPPSAPSIALCFFGLNRSLKWTGASILASILAPIERFNVESNANVSSSSDAAPLQLDVDIFFHTFSMSRSHNNWRAGER